MASLLLQPEPRADAAGCGSSPGGFAPDPPLLRDRTLLLLLALVALLQSFSWWQLEGYQLADSVEYMERARAHAEGYRHRGDGFVRSFGFSGLLVPFFWLSDALGLSDPRVVLHAVRLFQMALGLALVVACARIGSRLAGRAAGLGAAFIAGVNPVFLQYTVSPVSGVAAALCVALGVAALLGRGPRRGLLGGLALGAGLLMAYQTLLVALPLMALVALRNRRAELRQTATMLCGYALGVMAQIGLDKLTYGAYGVTLVNYMLENVGTRLSLYAHHLGLSDLAHAIYRRSIVVHGIQQDVEAARLGPVEVRDPLYYVVEIRRMLVVPIAALTALGLLLAALRPRWGTSILALALLANVLVMSSKSAKSFRLWLPLIPLIAPLAGVGMALLLGRSGARFSVPRRALVGLALAGGLVLGIQTLDEVNTRRHGVYWHAIEHVNEHAASAATALRRISDAGDAAEAPRPRVASAYHWAVFLRDRPEIELIKLPHHLDRWLHLDPIARHETLAALAQLDWLILHRPVLEQELTLFDAIADGFEVVAGFWTPEADPELGPVLVLRRAGHDPEAFPLVRTHRTDDPRGWRRELDLDRHLPEPLAFLEPPLDAGNPADGGSETEPDEQMLRRLVYLGWRSKPLPGSGLGWIEHHWWTDTGLARDWTIVDRVTDPTGKRAWQNNHVPGYGFRPTSGWEPGTLLVEGYTLVAGEKPFSADFAPLGGPWRRGDLIPAWMWLQVARSDTRMAVAIERGLPVRHDGVATGGPGGGGMPSSDGLVFSPDRLVRAGPFQLPVHELFRWADDGRPDPE